MRFGFSVLLIDADSVGTPAAASSPARACNDTRIGAVREIGNITEGAGGFPLSAEMLDCLLADILERRRVNSEPRYSTEGNRSRSD